MDWIKTNRYTSFAVFAITFIIYSMTVSPTVSYWDCGEFIACSYGLQVPHPPGAPFFLLVGRLFSMFPFVEDIGLRVNYISVLSSALTVMLLYLSIVHLIREWKGTLRDAADWRLAIFSGILGSLTFAFTHSFWFNAVEAEVYAPSMLFTALLVYLILVWAEKSEEQGNERYLLMISYLIGLAIGVHLLNVLALPFVIMIYYFKRFEYSIQSFIVMVVLSVAMVLFVYPGVVKYLPRVADVAGAVGLALVFIALLSIVLWSINNNKKLVSLVSLSVLLITIGYSTYTMIFIRSNLDPMIDENNPETIEKFISYLNREQYGDHSITDREKVWRESPNGKNYKSVSDYFWNYQINKMYIRYFLWQFAGMDENERDVSAKQLYMIPLILGVLGMVWHFRNDRRRALSVLALFFMTGLAIVLYLNQPDPQPRERDYSYVGSFFAFSLWIGLGYAGVMELIRSGAKEAKQNVGVASVVFGILLLASPVLLLSRNYESHSRAGRYIAWDYSYNMLQTCEPNALLITNGDNDTFPLWYLQEVDSVRRDVRVVNLSLLNTDWYIQQLRDLEPTVPVRMNDNEISQLGLIPWKKKKVSLDVPQSFAEQQASEFRDGFRQVNIEVPSRIAFEVEPALQTRYGSVLRVQDYMVLRILNANKWRKPVYFAVTVAKSNMLSELQQYMRMDGLAYKLVPYKNWNISPENLRRNLNSVYKYRGLQDSTVHYDKNIQGLLQNYRTAYLQLIEYHARTNQRQEISVLLEQMEERIPSEVIPWTNRYLRLLRDSYELTTGTNSTDSLVTKQYSEQELLMMGENMYRLNMFPQARDIFVNVYEGNPNNIQALSLLISVLERMGDYRNGISYLETWVKRNPRDANAIQKLASFKEKL